MRFEVSRRQFVRDTAAGTAALALMRLTPASAAPGDVQFGYAAITWQGQDRQAIDDVAAVGFKGIQLPCRGRAVVRDARMLVRF